MPLTTSTPTGATGPGKPTEPTDMRAMPGVGPASLPAAGGDATGEAAQAVTDSPNAPQAAASPDEAQRVRVDESTLKGRFNQAQATLGRNSTGIGDAGAARNEAAEAAEANAAPQSSAVAARAAPGPVADKPLSTGPSLSMPPVAMSDAASRFRSEQAAAEQATEARFNAQSTDSQNSF